MVEVDCIPVEQVESLSLGELRNWSVVVKQ